MNSKGFTLIELMIVVVVVAILAAIAYPSYTGHMTRVRRAEAQTALVRAAALQEKFYADCMSYAANLSAADQSDCAANRLRFTPTTEGGYYTLTVSAGTIDESCNVITCGYTLVATPGGRQAGNGNLRIDSHGTKQWDRDGDADGDSFCCSWTDR